MNAASAFRGESEGNDLHLEPGKPRVYQFSFLPLKEDVGGQIEVGWTSCGSKNKIFLFRAQFPETKLELQATTRITTEKT